MSGAGPRSDPSGQGDPGSGRHAQWWALAAALLVAGGVIVGTIAWRAFQSATGPDSGPQAPTAQTTRAEPGAAPGRPIVPGAPAPAERTEPAPPLGAVPQAIQELIGVPEALAAQPPPALAPVAAQLAPPVAPLLAVPTPSPAGPTLPPTPGPPAAEPLVPAAEEGVAPTIASPAEPGGPPLAPSPGVPAPTGLPPIAPMPSPPAGGGAMPALGLPPAAPSPSQPGPGGMRFATPAAGPPARAPAAAAPAPPAAAPAPTRAGLVGSRPASSGRPLIIPPSAPARKSGEVAVCTDPDFGGRCTSFGADVPDLAAQLGTRSVGSIQVPPAQIAALYTEPDFAGQCTTVGESNPRLNRSVASIRVGVSCKAFATPPEPIRPIASGQTLTGRIDPADQRDLYTFEGRAGQLAFVRLERTAGNLDPFLYLYDSTARLILDTDDDGAGDRNALIAITLPSGGTYVVAAASFASRSIGDYRLTLTLMDQLPPDEPDREVASGQRVRAFINHPGDSDTYTFSAQAGQVLSLFMERPNASQVLPRLSVRGPDGQLLCVPQAFGPPRCETRDPVLAAINPAVLPVGGRYSVVASASDGTTGVYTLSIQVISPRNITTDAPLHGTIDPPGMREAFTVDAATGEFITIRAVRTSGDLIPDLFLYDPRNDTFRGTQVLGTGETLIDRFPVGIAGRYIVLIEGRGTTSGSYELTLLREVQPPPGVRAICPGQTVGGRITADGQVDIYTFQASPGIASISVQPVAGSNLQPQLTLRDPDGRPLTGVQGTFELPARGQYTLEVRSVGGTTGAYQLLIFITRAVSPGQPLTGRFTCINETHFFAFGAAAGQRATISLTRLDGDLIPLVLLSTQDSRFQVFSSDDGKGNARIVETLPQTGAYSMLASPSSGTGAYQLTLQLTGAGTPAAAGPTAPPLPSPTAPPLPSPTALPTPLSGVSGPVPAPSATPTPSATATIPPTTSPTASATPTTPPTTTATPTPTASPTAPSASRTPVAALPTSQVLHSAPRSPTVVLPPGARAPSGPLSTSASSGSRGETERLSASWGAVLPEPR